MNLERLRDILGAFGADPAHWPEAERESAMALMQDSDEAGAMRDEAARLDALLNMVPAPELKLDAAKVVAGVAAAHGKVRALKPRRGAWNGMWPSAAGLAAAAAAGFMVGWLNLAPAYYNISANGDVGNGDQSLGYAYSEVEPW